MDKSAERADNSPWIMGYFAFKIGKKIIITRNSIRISAALTTIELISFPSHLPHRLCIADDEVAILKYNSQWLSTFDLSRLFRLVPVSIMILLSRCKLFIVQINERKQRVREHFLPAASVSPMNIMGKLTRLYGIADTINTNQTTIYTKNIEQTSCCTCCRWMKRRIENEKKNKIFTTIRWSRKRRRPQVDVAASVK